MEDGQEMTQFVYGSDAWKAGDFTICYLSEQFRQKDDVSISILNEIRSGQVSEKSHALLKTRFTSVLTAEQIAQTTIEPTRLYTHNINVDQVNDTALGKVPGPEYQYEMKMKGKPMLVDMLKKSCLAPEILRLRKGARVMCVKNNFEQGYVNGTLGVVVSCGPGVAPVIAVVPSREYPDGRKITIEQATWKIEDDGKVLAEITQYPLRLAWAITVHKSQGMSLDAVEVDLSRSFEPGMGYVALSRVRTLAGLRIIGMNTTALEVHAGVLEYDGVLQSRSGHAEKEHEHTNQDRLIEAQKKFLARVASQHKIRSEKQPTIEITAELIGKRKTLKAIAKERNLTEDTVLDHVERLIEGGYEIDISYMKKDISYAHFCKIQDAFAELVEGSEEDSDDGNGEGAESSRPLPLLSPIKSKVGANISFKEIRLARILLGYVKAKLENI
jgi:hypothetical protein